MSAERQTAGSGRTLDTWLVVSFSLFADEACAIAPGRWPRAPRGMAHLTALYRQSRLSSAFSRNWLCDSCIYLDGAPHTLAWAILRARKLERP